MHTCRLFLELYGVTPPLIKITTRVESFIRHYEDTSYCHDATLGRLHIFTYFKQEQRCLWNLPLHTFFFFFGGGGGGGKQAENHKLTFSQNFGNNLSSDISRQSIRKQTYNTLVYSFLHPIRVFKGRYLNKHCCPFLTNMQIKVLEYI